MNVQITGELIPAALKMLQPVKPTLSASISQRQIYQVRGNEFTEIIAVLTMC